MAGSRYFYWRIFTFFLSLTWANHQHRPTARYTDPFDLFEVIMGYDEYAHARDTKRLKWTAYKLTETYKKIMKTRNWKRQNTQPRASKRYGSEKKKKWNIVALNSCYSHVAYANGVSLSLFFFLACCCLFGVHFIWECYWQRRRLYMRFTVKKKSKFPVCAQMNIERVKKDFREY